MGCSCFRDYRYGANPEGLLGRANSQIWVARGLQVTPKQFEGGRNADGAKTLGVGWSGAIVYSSLPTTVHSEETGTKMEMVMTVSGTPVAGKKNEEAENR